MGEGRCPKLCLSKDDDDESDIIGNWASFSRGDDDDDDSLTEEGFAGDIDEVLCLKSRDWVLLLLGIDGESEGWWLLRDLGRWVGEKAGYDERLWLRR